MPIVRYPIFVKTNKKQNKIHWLENQENNLLIVEVQAPPIDGRANKMIVELLSEFFKTSKSSISIKTGKKSKNKIVEINQ